ncbi:MAG: hypothetical protein KJS92_03265 [Bacteroidetes bacterium]|nr:hypothetical protein [Bacteroidota bacterium]
MKQRLFSFCGILLLTAMQASAQKNHDSASPPDITAPAQTPRAWLIDYQINDSFSGFEVMDSAAKYGRFFLGGEDHRFMEFNSAMELKLMRYLHKRGGVRNMILELGFARGYVLQQYINTGDSIWLDILDNTTGSDYMDMYRAMREWNRELPDSAKVIVSGIDVERYTDVPLLLLEQLLPDSGIPDDLLVGVEAIKGLARQIYHQGSSSYEEEDEEGYDNDASDVSAENYEVRPTLRLFLAQFDSLKPQYRSYLGKNFGLTDTLLRSLKQYLEWDDYEYTPFQYTFREKVMYDNMKALLLRYPKGKFYGQFGRCHAGTALQNGPCGWLNYNSISQKMSTLMPEPFRSHVVTIGYFYADGADDDEENDKNTQEQEVEAFAAETPEGSVALFSLDTLKKSYPVLASRYDFVLFNNITEEDFDYDEEEDYDYQSEYEFTHMSYVYHREWTKLGPLNQALQGFGLPLIADNLVMQGFDIAYFPTKWDESAGGRFSMLWLPTRNLRYGAQSDSMMRFNMFRAVSETSKDLLRSRHFNLAIGTGIGFAMSRLELKAADKPQNFLNPLPTERVLYRNPALLVSVAAHFRYALGPLSLGISGGVGRDLSRADWRYEGKRLPGTPKFAQHTKYLEATLGFVIKE